MIAKHTIFLIPIIAASILSIIWSNKTSSAKPLSIQIKTDTVFQIRTDKVVKKTADFIDIVAVGDMMLGTNFPDASTLPPNEGKDLLVAADSLIRNATVSFGNLEGVFLDQGGISKEPGQNVYNFRQPIAYAKHLQSSGFDLISIANNHINDFGTVGITSTVKTLQEKNIAFAGTPKCPYSIIERNGIKIGLIAFAPHSGCLNMLDTKKAIELVMLVKAKTHILLVSFHGGGEGAKALHVTRKKEVFYDQDRGNVFAFSRAMVDAGADMIVGHGPHVPRAMELYKSKLIAYSLGNFCTYARFNLKGPNGLAPLLMARLDTNGNFISGRIASFIQVGEGGPIPDPDLQAAKLISKLSKEDMPESNLLISEDGVLAVGSQINRRP